MATPKAAPKKSAPKKTAPAAKKAAPKKAAPAAKKAAPKKAAPAAKKTAPKRVMSAEDRARYKVSPLRGMELDKWFASNVSGWQADFVRRVLGVVAKAVPGSSVEIKWRQPVVALNGKDFVFVRTAKAHVAIGLWRGIAVDDPTKMLDAQRFVRVTDPTKFDERAFAAIAKQAARARG